MAVNPFGSFGSDEDTSFETGNPVQQGAKKVTQAVSDQVAKQAHQITQDIVAQLFGSDASKSTQDTGTDEQGQNQKQQNNQQQKSSPVAQQLQQMQQQQNQFPGLQTDADQQKYAQLQQQLAEEQKKEQEKKQETKKTHMQNYYEPTLGSLETELKKLRQQEEQKKKQEEEQEEQKKEEKKMELQEQKKKEDVVLHRAQRHTEVKITGAG